MRLTDLAKRWPLETFFVVATAFTWSLLPFARVSIPLSLVALCGPAMAALATAALCGPDESRALLARVTLWRVPLRWYLVAFLSPLPISALASGLESLAGASGPLRLQPISPLQMVVFILVVGEEIGWRGFALPILLTRTGPWRSNGILGTMWAFWHLPLFYLQGMPQYGSPFLPFVGYTVALSVLLALLAQKTGGSVVIATLFHGAVNTLGVVNSAATPAQRGWGNAAAYGLVALAAGLAVWKGSVRTRPSSRT